MKPITVFTPTFNRAFCLHQLYQSLVRQTSKDFCWLIIDDGSSDNTRQLIDGWKAENLIEIAYYYKSNGGMHTAHNKAYQLIGTELNVCIDSDDFMPDDAIEKMLQIWKQNRRPELAGIIGLDAVKEGAIVGTKIPEEIRESTLAQLYHKHGVKGDKKVVLRTDIVREFPPYPEYESEKLVPLGTLYTMIGRKYKFLCSNQVFCVVQYLADGSSNNILKQYRKSPRGFAYARKIELQDATFIHAITRSMHLVSAALFSKKVNILENNPRKLITMISIPLGWALHLYIRLKTR
jgi:glycosyltransferase involved in cell wall biosynthesis